MNASTTIILSTCLLLISVKAAASDSRIDFEVLLDARPVGTHSFDIKQAADGNYQVASVAAFDVKFLGIVVYRYRHQATERWSQGCLRQIDSSTDDNGKRARVAKLLRDGCISSYAYWDPERLLIQHELLNQQTGFSCAAANSSLICGIRRQASGCSWTAPPTRTGSCGIDLQPQGLRRGPPCPRES